MRSRKALFLAGCVMVGLVFLIGCSDDDDPIKPAPVGVSETIGATGGSLEIANALTLTVPANALVADVDFVAKVNTSPPPAPSGFTLLSPVYNIEPSGTTFAEDVALRMNYAATGLGGADESDVVIFTDDGTGWDALSCSVYEALDYAETDITHLSDFVVAVPTPVEPGDVYAELNVHRTFSSSLDKPATVIRFDFVSASFAAIVEGEPGPKVQAESVAFGEWDLIWGAFGTYRYLGGDPEEFLTIGGTYDFVVVGNEAVSSLETPVTIMGAESYITNLEYMQNTPLSGFTVDWQGTEAGSTVELEVSSDAGPSFTRVVPNNGTYTFTANDLSAISAGLGHVAIEWDEDSPIVADGYDTDSRVHLATEHVNPVIFTTETTISEVTLSSTPALFIPDGPSGGGAGPAATNVINVAAVGTVDSVRVYLDITHQWPSDLIVKVKSPDGTELRTLFIGEGGEPEHDVHGWYPGDYVPKDDLNGFDGDASNGAWTITAQDYSNEQTGTLNEWRLQIFYAE